MKVTRYRKRHRWLSARDRLITSSDIPVLFGFGFGDMDPLTLYHQKRGELVGSAKSSNQIRFGVGHALEPYIASLAEEQLGIQTVDPGEMAIIYSEEYPWAGATVDRLILRGDEVEGVLELKTVHPQRKSSWESGPDPYTLLQLLYQLMVTGTDVGAAAALLGFDQFTAHPVDLSRYHRLADEVMDRAWAFHKRVQAGDPPAATAASIPTLRQLYPESNPHKSIFLPPDEGWLATADHYRELRTERNRVKRDLQAINNMLGDLDARVMQTMKDSERLEVGDELVAQWRTIERKGYTVEPKTQRKLNVKVKEE